MVAESLKQDPSPEQLLWSGEVSQKKWKIYCIEVVYPIDEEYSESALVSSRVGEDSMFLLSDYIEGQPPSILQTCQDLFGESVNAVWVRGRIPAIFGSNILISLSVPDYKYALIEQMFMACELGSNGDWVAYSFICEDYNLRAGLRFNPDDSLTEIYERIAKAFWELLLLEPKGVCAFRDGYLHYNDEMGYEEWHNVVFKHGRFSIEIIVPALF